MSSKPILFNTKMVKAVLDGIKTQTRRVVNKEYLGMADIEENNIYVPREDGGYINILNTTWSKYKVGDILWVREPAKIMGNHKQIGNIYERTCNFKYLADDKIIEDFNIPYRFSASHINHFLYKNIKPTWLTGNKGVPNGCIKEMARIFLKVTNVRVERLQDISDDDCIKEGISEVGFYPDEGYPLCTGYMAGKDDGKTALANTPQKPFSELWNSTTKKGYKWEDNPYVFVYDFEKVEVC